MSRIYFSGYSGCTNKDCIATQLSLDKDTHRQIRKMFARTNYVEDVLQDLIVQVLTTNDDTLMLKAAASNQMNFYFFRILNAERNTPRSRTNRRYSRVVEYFPDQDTRHQESELDKKERLEHIQYIVRLIKEELARMELYRASWYDSRVFTHYIKLRKEYEERGEKLTFERFGKEMNVNHYALFKVIKKVKARLKKRFEDEL